VEDLAVKFLADIGGAYIFEDNFFMLLGMRTCVGLPNLIEPPDMLKLFVIFFSTLFLTTFLSVTCVDNLF